MGNNTQIRLPFLERRHRYTSNMKLNKYIVLSLLLIMCHRLNLVHCSETENRNSKTESVPVPTSSLNIDSDSSKVEQKVNSFPNDIPDCSNGENCNENEWHETEKEQPGYVASEKLPKEAEKDTKPISLLVPVYKNVEAKSNNGQSDRLDAFSNFDNTVKGFLTKKDVPGFMKYISIDKVTKISTLEISLFITCIDVDNNGMISSSEFAYTSEHIQGLMRSAFDRIRSEDIECIYEEDLELYSDNVEFDFLLLDRNYDDCFSFDELEGFFYRFGIDPWKNSANAEENKNKVDRGDYLYTESDPINDEAEMKDVEENLLGLATFKEFSPEDQKFSTVEEAIDALWESIDENEDGHLSPEELVADLEWYGFEAAAKVAVPLFALMDINMDDRVSKDELKSFFKNPPTENVRIKEWMNTFWQPDEIVIKPSQEKVKFVADPNDYENYISKWMYPPRTFTLFDKNGDRHIDWDELKLVMTLYRQYNSDSLVDTVTDTIDLDKDGRISLAEFVSAVGSSGNQFEVQMQYMDEMGNIIEPTSNNRNLTDDITLAFEKMDENEDGFIVSRELKVFLELKMELLSDEDLEEIFATLDINKNGLVAVSDIHKFLSFVPKSFHEKDEIDLDAFKFLVSNALKETVSEKEVDSQFTSLDINEDNMISTSEFQNLAILYGMSDESEILAWMEKTLRDQPVESDEDFNDAFQLFDQDGNDIIDKDELWRALTLLKVGKATERKLDKYFIRLDINGDNVISMTEFKILLWSRRDE